MRGIINHNEKRDKIRLPATAPIAENFTVKQKRAAGILSTRLPNILAQQLNLDAARAMRDHHEAQARAWRARVEQLERQQESRRAAAADAARLDAACDAAIALMARHAKMPAASAAAVAARDHDLPAERVLAGLRVRGALTFSRAERTALIMELRAAGMTNAAIGREVGLSRSQVGRIIKRQTARRGAESRPAPTPRAA